MSRIEQLLALTDGVHPDVDAETYHARAIGVVGKGALDRIHHAPAVYRAWIDGLEKADTPALRFGRALHLAILEPARFEQTYVLAPDFGSLRKNDATGTTTEQGRENKKRRDDWHEAHKAAVILDSADGVRMLGMIRAIVAHPLARPLLERGLPEATVIAKCPETGLRAKVRPDDLRDDIGTIVDVKRSEDASPKGFARSIAKYRYHVQDALYRTIAGQAGLPIRHFVFVAVEPEAPYLVAVHSLTEDALRAGHNAWRLDARTLADCLSKDQWPGYDARIHELSLPSWAS